MHRWLDPRSRRFRVVLSMALLAWAVLASGALMAMPHMTDTMGMATMMQMPASHAPTKNCDGMSMEHIGSNHHASVMPMGHGSCCHGGCHCPSSCTGVLVALYPLASAWPLHTVISTFVPAEPALTLSAPPLRPPIA